MLRAEVHHICRIGRPANFKLGALLVLMEHEEPHHGQRRDLQSQRHPPDRCRLINREQKVPEIPKLVGRLPTPRAISK